MLRRHRNNDVFVEIKGEGNDPATRLRARVSDVRYNPRSDTIDIVADPYYD